MENKTLYFKGFEGNSKGGWYILKTDKYIINSFGEYVTDNGIHENAYTTLEDARMAIHDSEKGYIRIIGA